MTGNLCQEAFSDLTGAQQFDGLSYAMYNTAQTYAGLTTLPWIDFNSIRDDDAQKGSSTTDGAEINAEFETFKYTKDDWATDTYWNDHYYLIGAGQPIAVYSRFIEAHRRFGKQAPGRSIFYARLWFF